MEKKSLCSIKDFNWSKVKLGLLGSLVWDWRVADVEEDSKVGGCLKQKKIGLLILPGKQALPETAAVLEEEEDGEKGELFL